MTEEQFTRADEIVKRIAALTHKKNQLESVLEHGVKTIDIDARSNRSGSTYKLTTVTENVGVDALRNQPKSICVLLDAFIQTSISVYKREIDELEKEFNQL